MMNANDAFAEGNRGGLIMVYATGSEVDDRVGPRANRLSRNGTAVM